MVGHGAALWLRRGEDGGHPTLALNQGAYNAGVAVVLAWALATGRTDTAAALLVFVVAMAAVGAASVRWTIFVVQGVPALLALLGLALA